MLITRFVMGCEAHRVGADRGEIIVWDRTGHLDLYDNGNMLIRTIEPKNCGSATLNVSIIKGCLRCECVGVYWIEGEFIQDHFTIALAETNGPSAPYVPFRMIVRCAKLYRVPHQLCDLFLWRDLNTVRYTLRKVAILIHLQELCEDIRKIVAMFLCTSVHRDLLSEAI